MTRLHIYSHRLTHALVHPLWLKHLSLTLHPPPTSLFTVESWENECFSISLATAVSWLPRWNLRRALREARHSRCLIKRIKKTKSLMIHKAGQKVSFHQWQQAAPFYLFSTCCSFLFCSAKSVYQINQLMQITPGTNVTWKEKSSSSSVLSSDFNTKRVPLHM